MTTMKMTIGQIFVFTFQYGR